MEPFIKVVNPCTTTIPTYIAAMREYHDMDHALFCKIAYDGRRLSITGVEGPKRNGDAYGRCGQIVTSMLERGIEDYVASYAHGWDAAMFQRFLVAWDHWHLNDMIAGTPKQQGAIRAWKACGNKYTYDDACAFLQLIDLHVDHGYVYASKWLTEEVPDDVLAFLANLPDTELTPAWV